MPANLLSPGRLQPFCSVALPPKQGSYPGAKTPRNCFCRCSSRRNSRSDKNYWNVFKQKNCRTSDIRLEMRSPKSRDSTRTRVRGSHDFWPARPVPPLRKLTVWTFRRELARAPASSLRRKSIEGSWATRRGLSHLHHHSWHYRKAAREFRLDGIY